MTKWTCRLVPAVLAIAAVLGTTLPAAAQSKDEKKRQKEMQEALQREARPVVLLVTELQKKQGPGDAQAFVVNPKEEDLAKAITPGTPAVDAKAIALRYDMMKAADGKVYVPYTLSFPAELVPGGPVSVYVRVVPKGQTAPAGQDPKQDQKQDQKNNQSIYAFEDYFTSEARASAGQPARLTRAFAAAPGEYDVYFGMRAKAADPKKSRDEPVRVVAAKHTVTLPNFWDGELTTSTIVVTSKVDQVTTQVTPEMQRERPYLFGQTEFVPSFDHAFKKTDELSVVFQIYNPALDAGKPNVAVEYTFHQKLPEGEKYFNKTNPQQLNAQTLPPNFDVATTQMLPGGQSVPLASFPAGEYRMEIKITDALAKKTITRDVLFTVAG